MQLDADHIKYSLKKPTQNHTNPNPQGSPLTRTFINFILGLILSYILQNVEISTTFLITGNDRRRVSDMINVTDSNMFLA